MDLPAYWCWFGGHLRVWKAVFDFWTITIIYFGVVYWRERHAPILQFREANSQGLNYLAFAVAIAIAVLAALFINRPDADDSVVYQHGSFGAG
jgi:hypothetical protein